MVCTAKEEDIDARVKEALLTEDLDIIIDLRELNEGRAEKVDVFWEKCSAYISECSAVPERCHGEVCFMAKALSVRDQSVRCLNIVHLEVRSHLNLGCDSIFPP